MERKHIKTHLRNSIELAKQNLVRYYSSKGYSNIEVVDSGLTSTGEHKLNVYAIETSLDNPFADNLNAAIKNTGLDFSKVARRLNIKKGTFHYYTAGKCKDNAKYKKLIERVAKISKVEYSEGQLPRGTQW